MASAKIASLLIRPYTSQETIAKPISAQIKNQAKQHERFRGFCVDLAQMMYRTEVRLRTGILGEPAKHIRPLSETKAIENGANALAEGFLFAVAAGIIIGETWRTSRNQSKRRDDVDEKLEDLDSRVSQLTAQISSMTVQWEEKLDDERRRNNELARILERMVEIGLRGGWAEFEETPLRIPKIELASSLTSRESTPSDDTRIDIDTSNEKDEGQESKESK